MSDKDKLREAMDAIIEGRKPPDDVHIHLTKTTTKADWDALDPNSYETECAKCGAYVVGQFGPNHETNTPLRRMRFDRIYGRPRFAGGRVQSRHARSGI